MTAGRTNRDSGERVLILRHYTPRDRSHALDCPWVNGNHHANLDYVVKEVREIPQNQPRCSHCGGGR